MTYRKKILVMLGILLLVSLFSYLYSLYIINCNQNNDYSCSTFFFYQVASAFVATPLFIAGSLLILLFFPERVYNVWRKFAIFAIPLMLIGIFTTGVDPMECGNLICIDRTFMIFFTGYVYLGVSIILIIVTWLIPIFKNRN